MYSSLSSGAGSIRTNSLMGFADVTPVNTRAKLAPQIDPVARFNEVEHRSLLLRLEQSFMCHQVMDSKLYNPVLDGKFDGTEKEKTSEDNNNHHHHKKKKKNKNKKPKDENASASASPLTASASATIPEAVAVNTAVDNNNDNNNDDNNNEQQKQQEQQPDIESPKLSPRSTASSKASSSAAKSTTSAQDSTSSNTTTKRKNYRVVRKGVVLKPFLVVNEVAFGSPACEADMQPGDLIVEFGSVTYKNGGFQSLGPLISSHKDRPIDLTVISQGKIRDLVLTPHEWSGRGLLGAHLGPYERTA